jgi:hypothetical protein
MNWLKNMTLKYFIIILFIISFVLFLSFVIDKTRETYQTKLNFPNSKEKIDSTLQKAYNDTITIVGVGDIMLGTDYPSASYLPPSGTCTGIFNNVKPYMMNADITFGNLEGSFAGIHGKAKDCNNPKMCYIFRMPEQYVNCLVDAGFNLLSVANNHVNDFGYEGSRNSTKILDRAGISYAGLVDKPYVILERNKIKFGFCAFAPNSGTEDLNDINNAISIVQHLDTIADIVIVSFHGGAEGKDYQHVTRENEFFLGQNRGNVYEFAHKVIDAGADIIFGHGPHVTRAIEIYNTRFIIYSLGNFCTYSRINLTGPNGFAPIMKIFVDKNGKFLKAQIIPIYQEGEGIPYYDPQARAIKKIQELTSIDFPEKKFVIHDNGLIYSNP